MSLENSRVRSLAFSQRLRQRTDESIRQMLAELAEEPDYSNLESLMISDAAWQHVVRAGFLPQLVFAHPQVLRNHPRTSQYYRGITLLSQKRVGQLASSVATWERERGARSGRPAISPRPDQCLAVARLYNGIISSIIEGSISWTLENGYRNIIATMGIGLDGEFRNAIGRDAEDLIKQRVLSWLAEQGLLTEGPDSSGKRFMLRGDTVMVYGSEPDISFEKNGTLVCTIEIKGGRDKAGALERLGAMQKSFDETPPGCTNVLVAGVITKEMRTRLAQIGSVKPFLLDDLSRDGAGWNDFVVEVFHHIVRIA